MLRKVFVDEYSQLHPKRIHEGRHAEPMLQNPKCLPQAPVYGSSRRDLWPLALELSGFSLMESGSGSSRIQSTEMGLKFSLKSFPLHMRVSKSGTLI